MVQIHRLLGGQFLGLAFKNNTDLRPGQNLDLAAAPYFFNANDITQLSFLWSANNEPVTGSAARPDILHLEVGPEIPAGTIYDLAATVQNTIQKNETGSNFLRITIK